MAGLPVSTIIAMAVGALLAAGLRRRASERFIPGCVFPARTWSRVRRRHPHLNDAQLELVGAALREYFRLCGTAGRRMLAMVSQGVDSARREFIVIVRNEQHLCRRGLGRFPQRTPADAGPRANSGAIACDSSRTGLLFVSICTGEPE